jgi:hypothetical protein
MSNTKKLKLRSKTNQHEVKTSSKRSWKTIAFALYITFILLSTIPFIAERSIEPQMKDTYDYHLTYRYDGRQSHYYVERVNTSQIGKIDLTYTTSSNSLEVSTKNLKIIHIYCRSMYENECRKVFGIDTTDNSNYYKWYFIEKNHLNVNIDADHEIEELKFIDTPIPYKVVVNGVKWLEDVDYFYLDNHSTALSNVPEGHTTVDIYFKPIAGTPPTAILNASRTVASVNQTIDFDASGSYDKDGIITTYIMDFGDGTFRSGSKLSYRYSKPGVYGVILMVHDNDYLVDHAFANITVVESSNIPEIQGRVPDQIKPEDSPPWTLNLSNFEPIPTSSDVKFHWYLTGENSSMYRVTGENSTNDQLVFMTEPDAFGSNLVTLWLHSTENLSSKQNLWINITPVNDPPTLLPLPDLIVHYNDPYTFDYKPYIDDKETPIDELSIEIFDGYEENYISIHGLNATYTYPYSLLGDTIYATVKVSDGEATVQDVIEILVTSDQVPKLTKSLPDIWLFEGTTKYNVFNLDDYFTDPDNDAIFFSYGQSHLEITIHKNHTVDFSAASEWTGVELVTFRARDPIGAIAEDSIIVTVLPVNDPPSITGVPDFFIHYDNDYRFDLTPYINDNDNTTSELLIIPSDTDHVRVDIRYNLVIILNYPETLLGQSQKLRLTVTDGIDSGFQEVTVTITKDFPPELISPIPDILFIEDEPIQNALDLDHYFLDIDGDVLYYTAGNTFVKITIHNDHTIDLSSPQDWFGSELVYFRATDPTGALQQDLVMVTVLPVNDAPVLLEIPPQYGNESERWILDLEPYIYDVDNNISDLEISVDNEYVIVSGSSLVFFGSRELPKQIEVIVSDGAFRVSQTIEVHLKKAKKPYIPTMWDFFIDILPFLVLIILILVGIAGAIYRKKSRFIAEEVFLIHQGGTLITHLSRNVQANVDDIIFSGMFTAVQDFIKDTFTPDASGNEDTDDNQWALDELKLGDNNILIERSDNTYLAVIFSGEGSKRLRKIVIKLLGKIETKYENMLPTWDGNISEMKETKKILSVLIKVKDDSENDTDQSIENFEIQSIDSKEQSLGQTPSITDLIQSPEPVVSSPITMARPVKHRKKDSLDQELLNYTGRQLGSGRRGLAAIPLKVNRTQRGALSNRDRKILPMALQIRTQSPLPKTIVFKQGRMMEKKTQKLDASPSGLIPEKKPKTLKISLSDGKDLNLDTSRSILAQLAEIDDED